MVIESEGLVAITLASFECETDVLVVNIGREQRTGKGSGIVDKKRRNGLLIHIDRGV